MTHRAFHAQFTILGMGSGGSGEDTTYEVSELGSDAKTLSSGLSLTVVGEGLSIFVEGIEGVTGVLSQDRACWN